MNVDGNKSLPLNINLWKCYNINLCKYYAINLWKIYINMYAETASFFYGKPIEVLDGARK